MATTTRSRQRSRTTGKAGAHSRRMKQQNRIRALAWAAPIAALAALEIPLLAGQHLSGAAVAAAAALGCGAVVQHHWQRADKQAIGVKAEQQVLDALRKTDAHHIINGADVGARGDADHIAITPRGIAVIETKAGGGQVRILEGRMVTGQGRVVPGDPVGQVLAQAAAVERRTRRPVTAIVCVPWMRNAPLTYRGVIICSTGQLSGVLRRMDDPLREHQATACRHALGA